jgi:hypothetical protein
MVPELCLSSRIIHSHFLTALGLPSTNNVST